MSYKDKTSESAESFVVDDERAFVHYRRHLKVPDGAHV